MRYVPVASVIAEREKPVDVFVTVTLTPGSARP